jgi:uncharacterized protein YegL
MPTLYDDVVTITYNYLGPPADRFVARQIRSHLQKEPDQLQRKDLRQLIDWIQLAVRLVSSDNNSTTIDSYVADLEALTHPKPTHPKPMHSKRQAAHDKTAHH